MSENGSDGGLPPAGPGAEKPLEAMTAQELYELARRKEAAERAVELERRRAVLTELRERRREIEARHRRELLEIDKEIRALAGDATPHGKSNQYGDVRRREGISRRVVELLQVHGPLRRRDIERLLAEQGVPGGNLGQTMAHLRKRGAVTTLERGIYAAVETIG